MKETNKRALAISLGDRNRWDASACLSVRPCFVDESDESGPRPTSYRDDKWNYGPDNFYLGSFSLSFTTYVNFKKESPAEIEPVGAWNLHYRDVTSVELVTAECMVKTLTSLRNKLHKLNAEHGDPTDFFTSIKRIAVATKSEMFLIDRPLAKRIGHAEYATDSQLWIGRHISNDSVIRKIQALPIKESEALKSPEYSLTQ